MDPFASWPGRTRLYDDNASVVLVYSESQDTRDGRPWADGAWRPESAPVASAVAAIVQRLGGYALSTSDVALAESLTAAGAIPLRHAHTMSHDLERLVPYDAADPSLVVEPLTAAQLHRHAQRLGELNLAAYPAEHPDHSADDAAAAVEHIRAIGRGELLGPLMSTSRVALSGGRIVGACLIVDREGEPPDGGPWVIDIFRDPASPVRGVGGALLSSAVAAAKAAGLRGVSLAVSHQNTRALELYARLGFQDRGQSWTLAVPG
jgi:ribosomal protein S18 acetylase RimI-like enzyme